jgi:RHS repeat-associated protein
MQINYGIDNMVKTIQKIDGGTISNKYDTANRLTAEHQNQLAKLAKLAVNYTMDKVGNPTNTLITVDGTPILTNAYTYDAAERISTINNGQSGTFTYQYNQYNGLLASASNSAAGITAAYQYDNMDRLTNITWRKPSGTILRSFAYQYNKIKRGHTINRSINRYYDPNTGRWLSKDPVGISGGLNQYVFCSNNPVNFVDPFGLCEEDVKTVMVSVAGARAAVVIGLLFDVGYIEDSEGNKGIYFTGGIGSGVEVALDNAILDFLSGLVNTMQPTLREGIITDQTRINPGEAHGGIGIGVQQNLKTTEVGLDIGGLGGGVYKSGTFVLRLERGNNKR